MSAWDDILVYRGEGQRLHERGKEAPYFDAKGWVQQHDPARYRADSALRDAVSVAVQLGLPLLLTGEPGVGKTECAGSVAWELGCELFVFNTKSTSTYADLLYRYDALGHFQDKQIQDRSRPVQDYITYNALGEAILLAADRTDIALPEKYRTRAQSRSVVLIDEVDKASRDFPNDLLNELKDMNFAVRELDGHVFRAEPKYRPIVILTSNVEKDLPEAFRRRCAYFHIEFPLDDNQGWERLREIIRQRLPGVSDRLDAQKLENALRLFLSVRQLDLEKKPATGEMLNWVDLLQRLALDVKDGRELPARDHDILVSSFALLVKGDNDLNEIRSAFARSGS